TFPSGIKRLEVRNGSGDVTVKGGPGEGVRVEADKQRFSSEDCELVFDKDGTTLRVEARPKDRWPHGHCEVSFRIDVPQGVDVRTTVGSGELRITGTRGEVSVTTGSGDVTIDGELRELDVKSGSGDVRVRGLPASARLHTGSGDVALRYLKAPGE